MNPSATPDNEKCEATTGGAYYPGSVGNRAFGFPAPMTPGRYAVRGGPTDQSSCGSAGYPGGTQVGLLIVQ